MEHRPATLVRCQPARSLTARIDATETRSPALTSRAPGSPGATSHSPSNFHFAKTILTEEVEAPPPSALHDMNTPI